MLIDGVNVIRKPFIDTLIKNAKDVPQLDGIIIFGSSVREDCTEKSDVDILFIASTVDFDDEAYSLAILRLLQSCYKVQMIATDFFTIRSFNDLFADTPFYNAIREDGYKYYDLR